MNKYKSTLNPIDGVALCLVWTKPLYVAAAALGLKTKTNIESLREPPEDHHVVKISQSKLTIVPCDFLRRETDRSDLHKTKLDKTIGGKMPMMIGENADADRHSDVEEGIIAMYDFASRP